MHLFAISNIKVVIFFQHNPALWFAFKEKRTYRMGAIYWFYKFDRKKVTCHGAGICRSYLALIVHSKNFHSFSFFVYIPRGHWYIIHSRSNDISTAVLISNRYCDRISSKLFTLTWAFVLALLFISPIRCMRKGLIK